MKINFLLPPSKRFTGGMLSVMEYAQRLLELGHDVSITTLPDVHFSKKNPWPWYNFTGKIYYYKVPFLLKPIFIFLLHRFFQKTFLSNLIYSNFFYIKAMPKCDVNIATWWEGVFAVYFSKKGKPVHFMQHYEELFYDRTNEFERLVCRLGYSLPIYKICNSSWLANLMKEMYNVDLPWSNNGIDLKDFVSHEKLSNKDGIIRIISYSRGDQWKGFADCMAAMKIVKEKYKNIEWHTFGFVNGIDPDNEEVDFIFHEKLSFKELNQLYGSCDIAICPSWYESFPLPPLEAMASGTAVITTKYGTEDYAFHEDTALVVLPRDIESIVSAIIRLIEDKKLRKKLEINGQNISKKFIWDIAVKKKEKQLEDIYYNRVSMQSDKFLNLHKIIDFNGTEFEFAPSNLKCNLKDNDVISYNGMCYLYSNGRKKHIPNVKALEEIQDSLGTNKIIEIDLISFNRIPNE